MFFYILLNYIDCYNVVIFFGKSVELIQVKFFFLEFELNPTRFVFTIVKPRLWFISFENKFHHSKESFSGKFRLDKTGKVVSNTTTFSIFPIFRSFVWSNIFDLLTVFTINFCPNITNHTETPH